MATVTEPIALDRSLNTTELSPRNLADVLAQALQALTTVVSGLNFINAVVVAELPTVGISTTTIYLVPSDDPQSENVYDEYINLDGTSAGWEKIGSTEIDLSNYYTKTETDTLLSAKADTSDIPTVNDGTLTIQQNGETKGTFTANQSGNSTVNIETPTTDIQTAVDEFETYNGGLLSSLKVSLTPNQDLHGYDSPWVGGSRKNKLPLVLADIKSANQSGTWSGNVYTWFNSTFEILQDSDGNVTGVKVGGTNSGANCQLNIPVGNLDGDYYFCGCANDGAENTYNVLMWDRTTSARVKKWDGTTNSDTATDLTTPHECKMVSGHSIEYRIRVMANASVNNVVCLPMIVSKTETDFTFEPYSNICPISGHTQAKVGDDGKNMFDGTFTDYTIIWSDGSVISNQNHKTSSFISVDPNTDYVLSGTDLYTRYSGETTGAVIYAFYDKDQNFLYWSDVIYSGDVVMHTTADTRYIRFDCGGKATDVQIELGSTKTAYVPYNGYQVTVNLGGTYYSGTLDVVTGVFTPDTAKQTYPWGTYTRTNDLDNTRRRILATLSDALGTVSSDIGANISDSVEEQTGWITDSPHFYIDSSNKTLVVFLPISTSDSTNIEVCYKLATPTPIQLSPTMVKALVGENHLSASLDGQEITESKYKQMFTFDDVIAYIQSLS